MYMCGQDVVKTMNSGCAVLVTFPWLHLAVSRVKSSVLHSLVMSWFMLT